MPDELESIFPDLAPFLRDTPLVTMSHGDNNATLNENVTMEQVDEYMRGKMHPQFRSGQSGPAPKSGWDAPGGNDPNVFAPGQLPSSQAHEPDPNEGTRNPDTGEQNDPNTAPDTGEREVPSTPPAPANDPSQTPQPTPAEMPQPFQQPDDPNATPPPRPNEVPQGIYNVGGRLVTQEQLDSLLAFQDTIAQDAELRATIEQHFAGGRSSSPGSPPPSDDPLASLPEEYRDDPGIQALAKLITQQSSELQRLSQAVNVQYETQASRQAREFETAVATGLANFQTARNLSDEDMAAIRTEAARLNIVDAYAQSLPPVAAVEKALEVAYFANETYRKREIDAQAQASRQDTTRKQKLAAISGSSGSTPRVQPAPTTPEGNRRAMVDAVGQMMNGTWTEGE